MGPPITTSTVAGSENAVISAASTTPAAPFDAVMALMTQVSVDPAAAGGALPSNGVPVVQPAVADGIPTVFPAFSATSAPQTPVSPAVSPSVVNAAAPADEAGLDALLAATALAGRGITARPPTPPAPAVPLSFAVPPEDFIGPVQPAVLTADAAAPSGVAAQPQEFMVGDAAVDATRAAAMDPDFIGPVRPAHWQAATVPVEAASDDAQSMAKIAADPALLSTEIVLADAPAVDAISAADLIAIDPSEANAHVTEAVQDGTVAFANDDLLPDAEALLQREAEVPEFDQPSVSAMATSLMPADAATPAPVHGAAPLADGNMMALHAAMMMTVSNEDAAPESRADDNQTIAIVPAEQGKNASRHGAPQHLVQQNDQSDEIIASATPDLAAIMPLVIAPVPVIAPVQTSAQNNQAEALIDDATAAPRTPLPPIPALAPRAADVAAMAPRDATLLQTMTTLSQPRTKTDIRSVAPVATSASVFIPVETSELSPERAATEGRSLAASDEARRLDLPVDRVTRDTVASEPLRSANDMPDAPLRDAKLTAVIHGVTIAGAAADDQLAPSSTATLAALAATPPMATTATATRDAPLVSAMVADGRRDTQRDAEIRERQIKTQVTAALRAGQQEVRMQLYPPGLGQILIRMTMEGGKLRLSMKAGSNEAADALVQTEAGLRDALARDGVALASFDVNDNDEKGRHSRQQVEPAATMNRATTEGDTFSVDMTA